MTTRAIIATHARTHGISLSIFAAKKCIALAYQGRTVPVDHRGCSAAFCVF